MTKQELDAIRDHMAECRRDDPTTTRHMLGEMLLTEVHDLLAEIDRLNRVIDQSLHIGGMRVRTFEGDIQWRGEFLVPVHEIPDLAAHLESRARDAEDAEQKGDY